MVPVSFADILMILVVCGIIFGILNLVNRSAKKQQSQPESTAGKTTSGMVEKNRED